MIKKEINFYYSEKKRKREKRENPKRRFFDSMTMHLNY